jgi:hypothetical protein
MSERVQLMPSSQIGWIIFSGRRGCDGREAVVIQCKKMLAPFWRFGTGLLLFCGGGGLFCAAIGFVMFLHLGPFKTPEDAGYAVGLFVKSGVQLASVVWLSHGAVQDLRCWVIGSPKKM